MNYPPLGLLIFLAITSLVLIGCYIVADVSKSILM